MNSVKILHTADLHLGSGRSGNNRDKSDGETAFLKIINACKSHSVDFLLIAGDLFDTPFVSSDIVSRVISAMEQIPDTIIAISAGNHDCACPGSVYLKYNFPKNVVIFSSFLEYIDFPQKNVRLMGAGFTDRFENIPLLQPLEADASDKITLCVLHGEVVAENSSSVYNPIHPSAISKSNIDYLALGHIHKRSEVQKIANTHYSYCGCHNGRGFDELGALGVYIGEVSKGSANLQFLETSQKKYIIEEINISDCNNNFDTADRIKLHLKQQFGEGFSDNFYRIILKGTVHADTSISPKQLQAVLSEVLSYVEVIDKSDPDIHDIERIAKETSLRGIFASKMIDKINSAAPENEEKYKNALKIGLRAFSKGVTLNDN